jgi:hypothetical protein
MKFGRIAALFMLFFFPLSSWALTLNEERKYGRQAYLQIVGSAKLFFDRTSPCRWASSRSGWKRPPTCPCR